MSGLLLSCAALHLVIHLLHHHMTVMESINFSAPAEIFASRSRGARHSSHPSSLKFYRFLTAAQAVQFVMESLPSEMLLGTVLEVDGDRFDGADIRKIYESSEYPLPRHRSAKSS